jgi:hypothetical protein
MTRQGRVFVTGGAGFTGSFATDHFIRQGYAVRVLDSLDPQVHPNGVPEYLNADAELIRPDIRAYAARPLCRAGSHGFRPRGPRPGTVRARALNGRQHQAHAHVYGQSIGVPARPERSSRPALERPPRRLTVPVQGPVSMPCGRGRSRKRKPGRVRPSLTPGATPARLSHGMPDDHETRTARSG